MYKSKNTQLTFAFKKRMGADKITSTRRSPNLTNKTLQRQLKDLISRIKLLIFLIGN